jgi:hypothetical protein
MDVMQEFLVIGSTDGSVGVFGAGSLPAGTIVSGEARRLRVVGQAPVKPTHPQLTAPEWEQWRQTLVANGYKIEEGPFWR